MHSLILAFISFSSNGLVDILIELVIAGVLFWAINWFFGYVGLSDPFLTVARVVLGLIALIIIIDILSSLLGGHHVWAP